MKIFYKFMMALFADCKDALAVDQLLFVTI